MRTLTNELLYPASDSALTKCNGARCAVRLAQRRLLGQDEAEMTSRSQLSSKIRAQHSPHASVRSGSVVDWTCALCCIRLAIVKEQLAQQNVKLVEQELKLGQVDASLRAMVVLLQSIEVRLSYKGL